MQQTVERFGGLDLFIANAGAIRAGSLATFEKEEFDLITSVNYTGLFLCAKYASAIMRAQHEADPNAMYDFIVISSKSGLMGSNKNFAYSGSKFGGTGYDDVVCFAPVKSLIEQAGDILGFDGCLNFFAGPTDAQFKAPFNWYNVHYLYTHVVGTSSGNTQDMQEAIAMMSAGKLNPSGLVTHIGGLNAVVDTTLNLPSIPGGKKLIYTHIDLPLTAIADFEELGKNDPLFAELDRLCKQSNNLWNPEAEKYLLANAKKI